MATSIPSPTSHTTGISTDITCPICMDKYSLDVLQNPVMLPNCGHTICRGCLTSIQKIRQTEHICPICRAPLNGINPKNLPANFLVLSMMQAHLDSSDDISPNHHKKIRHSSADRKGELNLHYLQWRPSPPTSPPRTASPVPTPTMSTRSRRSAHRPPVHNEYLPSRPYGEMDSNNTRLHRLYLAYSVNELNNMVEEIPSKNPKLLVNLAQKVLNQAYVLDERNDQEKTYVLFMRYFSIVSTIQKHPEYKKNEKYYDSLLDPETTSKIISRVETLHKSLERRYKYMLQNTEAYSHLGTN